MEGALWGEAGLIGDVRPTAVPGNILQGRELDLRRDDQRIRSKAGSNCAMEESRRREAKAVGDQSQTCGQTLRVMERRADGKGHADTEEVNVRSAVAQILEEAATSSPRLNADLRISASTRSTI